MKSVDDKIIDAMFKHKKEDHGMKDEANEFYFMKESIERLERENATLTWALKDQTCITDLLDARIEKLKKGSPEVLVDMPYLKKLEDENAKLKWIIERHKDEYDRAIKVISKEGEDKIAELAEKNKGLQWGLECRDAYIEKQEWEFFKMKKKYENLQGAVRLAYDFYHTMSAEEAFKLLKTTIKLFDQKDV